MQVDRSMICDADFTVLMLETARNDYRRCKIAAARAKEAVTQLGLEPLVRMADNVYINHYYPALTLSYQECVKPWLIPVIGELNIPWVSEWELGRFGLWNPEGRWGLRNESAETAVHSLTVQGEYLRSRGVNGRKRHPLDYIQLRIHQKASDWINDELTLPNGCVCSKSLEATLNDVVVSCRVPQ